MVEREFGRGMEGEDGGEEEGRRREERELSKSRNNRPEEGRRVGGGKMSRKRKAHRSQASLQSPLAHRLRKKSGA